MLIEEQYRECVVYLCVDVEDEHGLKKRTPAGTGFFVMVWEGGQEGQGIGVGYLVTAKHVIEESRKYKKLFIRINKSDGSGYDDIESLPENWSTHDNTDVACYRVSGFVGSHYRYIPFNYLVSDKLIERDEVGPGDEVFFVSLFSQYPGDKKNQPIVRFGHISLMPHVPMRIKLTKDSNTTIPVYAYLVESHSWGGHSGSPAFLYFPLNRRQGTIEINRSRLNVYLLGLVHGHFTDSEDVQFVGDLRNYGTGKIDINVGMAIIIPSQDIMALLTRPDILDERNEAIMKTKASQGTNTSPDSKVNQKYDLPPTVKG